MSTIFCTPVFGTVRHSHYGCRHRDRRAAGSEGLLDREARRGALRDTAAAYQPHLKVWSAERRLSPIIVTGIARRLDAVGKTIERLVAE